MCVKSSNWLSLTHNHQTHNSHTQSYISLVPGLSFTPSSSEGEGLRVMSFCVPPLATLQSGYNSPPLLGEELSCSETDLEILPSLQRERKGRREYNH